MNSLLNTLGQPDRIPSAMSQQVSETNYFTVSHIYRAMGDVVNKKGRVFNNLTGLCGTFDTEAHLEMNKVAGIAQNLIMAIMVPMVA